MGLLNAKKETIKEDTKAQDLAVAYGVKRKKYAQGGVVKAEAKPTPAEAPKAPVVSITSDASPMAPKPKMQSLNRSRMVESKGSFSVRDRDVIDREERQPSMPEPAPQSQPIATDTSSDQIKESPAPQPPKAQPTMADNAEMEHASSVAAAIMSKRAAKRMADGGMVEEMDEEPSDLDSLNEDAALKENYDSEEIDDGDVVSAIRRKMKLKSTMTNSRG